MRVIAKVLERERKRARHWRHYYKVTPEQVWRTFTEQNKRCAVCERPISLEVGAPFADRAQVDHCHTTGQFRGLLCVKCNTGLGAYEKYHKAFEAYLKAALTKNGTQGGTQS